MVFGLGLNSRVFFMNSAVEHCRVLFDNTPVLGVSAAGCLLAKSIVAVVCLLFDKVIEFLSVMDL